jgi:hypothetical protein
VPDELSLEKFGLQQRSVLQCVASRRDDVEWRLQGHELIADVVDFAVGPATEVFGEGVAALINGSPLARRRAAPVRRAD